MSVSKWAYDPQKCDGQPCPQDCDLCPKARTDNLDAGIYSDNPDDQIRYVQTTQPVDLWGYPKQETDMVEVVRCRDCWRKNAGTKDKENVHCGMFNMWMDSDFFCKFGEREKALNGTTVRKNANSAPLTP